MRISLGQMDVKLGAPDANLATARTLAAEAARRESDLLVLPELWSSGYDLSRAARHAAVLDEGIFAESAALAREFGLFVLGSCLSALDGGYGNTAVLFAPNGRALADYSKIHLFGLMEEDQYLTPGDRLVVVESAGGRFGLAICYDLRFPELFRAYALAGADLILLPAEWPHPRLAHWRVLLRARAIENQCFVVACNRVGTSGETTFCGHSAIVGPWGETVVEGGEEAELLTADIELSAVARARRRLPLLPDRRPDIYGADQVQLRSGTT
ncbi:MAG: carbon-nitrogen family hydrolase [Candidatus Promineifilaceae bacterium]|nr:carbon-nitrogen family hydrolase [Candidatus Promineifilaceae bacterium]